MQPPTLRHLFFLREGQTNYTFLKLTKLEESRTPYLATQKI